MSSNRIASSSIKYISIKENRNTETGKPDILADLEQLKLLAEEHTLTEEFFAKATSHRTGVAAVLKITDVQTALFVLLMEHSGRTPLETPKSP
ncbi:MAG: hypothetical protein LBK73_16600 [Treponema sp.]|jgi:hypothetical protein|nr:hypothetical protein [Treponema sp.]